eukprot:351599-Chlamydomonas_euryale.AAC.8
MQRQVQRGAPNPTAPCARCPSSSKAAQCPHPHRSLCTLPLQQQGSTVPPTPPLLVHAAPPAQRGAHSRAPRHLAAPALSG